MLNAPISSSRRWLTRAVALLAIVSLLFAASAWWRAAAPSTIVVVVRHADKARDGTVDPPLSPTGVERAERLAGILGNGTPYRVDAIFVSQYRRSVETAEPLAAASGIPIIRVWADDVSGLAYRIRRDYKGKRVLVVAHSDTIPQIVDRLGGVEDVPLIEPLEYGTTYVVAMPVFGRATVMRLMLP